ncbi:MAG: RluA family pseudouridine synthase [Planctomycetes bacterium]|nr:RluA family pseudouridine synthase [Planctomycetota bacterium]
MTDQPRAEPLVFINHSVRTRLDRFLCEQLPGRSRAFVQRLIERDLVSLTSGPPKVKPSTPVDMGAEVRVTLALPDHSPLAPRDIPLSILHEDDDFAAIDKAPGIPVHPAPGYVSETLVNALVHHFRRLSGIAGADRPGIVHRLDRDTSGVMLIAKNDVAHQRLSLQFKARTVRKTYFAVSHSTLEPCRGSIDLPIGRSHRDRKRMAIRFDGGRSATTEYEIARSFRGYAAIRVRPRTGRTHQIRVHLHFLEMPIVCDGTYGRERVLHRSTLLGHPRGPDEAPIIVRQALHAERISFEHPRTGQPMELVAPLPADILALLAALQECCPAPA